MSREDAHVSIFAACLATIAVTLAAGCSTRTGGHARQVAAAPMATRPVARDWRPDLAKAISLIDRPKQAAVDAFGPPDRVEGADTSLVHPTYIYKRPCGELSLTYNTGGTADFVDLSPASPVPAALLWPVLGARPAGPDRIFCPIWECKQDLMRPEGSAPLGVRLKDRTKGGWPMALTGTTAIKPWTGVPAFDTNTNSTNIATLSPNPLFGWEDVAVTDVNVGRAKYPSFIPPSEPWPAFALPLTPQNVEGS